MYDLLRSRTLLPGALHALVASTLIATAHAAEAPLALTPAQLATAGVTFGRATPASPAAGASLRLSGRVVVPNAGLEVVLAPADGRIESLLVNPGEAVRAGQPLLRLHSPGFLTLQRDLVAARAREEAVKARAERDAQLHADGIIARNRLEESRAALTAAEAEVREYSTLLELGGLSAAGVARLQRAQDIQPALTLVARRAGSVLQQLAAPGEAVAAGTPLLHIGRLDPLWLELRATRAQALQIRPGDGATVPGCPVAGRVLASALQLDAGSQTLNVRVELPQPAGCVTPNQLVEADLAPRASAPGLVQVPAASVVQQQGRSWVFVRAAGGVEPRAVTVERRATDAAWIASGLAAGEEVAITGLAAIKGAWLGLGAGAEAP